MTSRRVFRKLNLLAMVIVPFIVGVGRPLGGNMGWFWVMYLWGGFLLVVGFFAILFLIGLIAPDTPAQSRNSKTAWWLGTILITLALLIYPDFGDSPDSGTSWLMFNMLSQDSLFPIAGGTAALFFCLGLISFVSWIVLLVRQRKVSA